MAAISEHSSSAQEQRDELFTHYDFSTTPPTSINILEKCFKSPGVLVSSLQSVLSVVSEKCLFALIAEYAALEGLLVLNYNRCKNPIPCPPGGVAMAGALMVSQQSIEKCRTEHTENCNNPIFAGTLNDVWPNLFTKNISLHHLMNPDGSYKQSGDQLFLTVRVKGKDEKGMEKTGELSVVLTCAYVCQSDRRGKVVPSFQKCIEETVARWTRMNGQRFSPLLEKAKAAAAKVVPGEYQDLYPSADESTVGTAVAK